MVWRGYALHTPRPSRVTTRLNIESRVTTRLNIESRVTETVK